ncbi:hypothetical protein ACUXCC_000674 [Cytobacillus horneckiae]|uniref:ParB/Sulfiredoxin domain-containing protein n=1 Tax=Cytobacillus horneckiae TaxID=549687 RepID=A0A2N0ZJA0_9BACI|nr:hypothetical protein [Cytobacillus horneckiae]MBN6886019.1 hypothetical protein [Cytobacillus horneckiae]MEC1153932.1 hypothetical protein [Cytobacillus horneckiae]MED2938507.1 hypothetical protein [Cytobacillus horneckiae]PKG29561.1 hypothetical protein CWS20_06705 [Cytobacillus horneckiae]
MESKIKFYESESQKFQPSKHFISRIQEMENKSSYGAKLSLKWTEILNQTLINETYPVIHPIGQETFSLYAEFPTGVFEYALDIDGAISFIKENNFKPVKVSPSSIINSVDQGNINKDPNKIKPNHKNPVMVLQSHYLTDNKPYCINGNHRIFEAYRNNDKQIEIFVFKDLEFVPFFYDILSKAAYFFEIDYTNVVSNKRDFIKNEQGAFAYDL